MLGLRPHRDGSDLSGPGSACVDRLLLSGGDLLSPQTSSQTTGHEMESNVVLLRSSGDEGLSRLNCGKNEFRLKKR